jgi:hypothetical protein
MTHIDRGWAEELKIQFVKALTLASVFRPFNICVKRDLGREYCVIEVVHLDALSIRVLQ